MFSSLYLDNFNSTLSHDTSRDEIASLLITDDYSESCCSYYVVPFMFEWNKHELLTNLTNRIFDEYVIKIF